MNESFKCRACCLHEYKIRQTGFYLELFRALSNDACGLHLASCLAERRRVGLSYHVQVLPGFFLDADLSGGNLRIVIQKMLDQPFVNPFYPSAPKPFPP